MGKVFANARCWHNHECHASQRGEMSGPLIQLPKEITVGIWLRLVGGSAARNLDWVSYLDLTILGEKLTWNKGEKIVIIISNSLRWSIFNLIVNFPVKFLRWKEIRSNCDNAFQEDIFHEFYSFYDSSTFQFVALPTPSMETRTPQCKKVTVEGWSLPKADW